jgi:hypothetical protein
MVSPIGGFFLCILLAGQQLTLSRNRPAAILQFARTPRGIISAVTSNDRKRLGLKHIGHKYQPIYSLPVR